MKNLYLMFSVKGLLYFSLSQHLEIFNGKGILFPKKIHVGIPNKVQLSYDISHRAAKRAKLKIVTCCIIFLREERLMTEKRPKSQEIFSKLLSKFSAYL